MYPLSRFPLFSFKLEAFTVCICRFKVALNFGFHGIKTLLINNTLTKQLGFILSGYRLHFGNLLVHKWLSETWLIKLVVSKLSVTNQINNNIMIELLSVFSGSCEYMVHIVNALSVYVENWCIDGFGKV